MSQLIEIIDTRKKAAAKETRRSLFERCRESCNQFGDDIAGFAIVVWDGRGELRSAYDTTRGPIASALVPTLVSDALNRHVAVMLSRIQPEEAENE